MTARQADNRMRPVVVWLRDDLRLDDNPALAHAAESGRPVVPLVVLEEDEDGARPHGAAHRWWLHHSLEAFAGDLRVAGAGLVLRRGRAAEIVPQFLKECGAGALFVNRRYHQPADALDDTILDGLPGIEVERFDANLLHDPDRVRTKAGGYYKVYTPFLRSLRAGGEPRDPIDAPRAIRPPEAGLPRSDVLGHWALLPTAPDWSGGLARDWTPGEAAARRRFQRFCTRRLAGYHEGRERPAEDVTTRMSPHLRFGEISPHRLWHQAHEAARQGEVPPRAIETFRRELIWRDFNYHLLYHFGPMDRRNINKRFDALGWRSAPEELRAWQRGRTGYPIVDAAMRQLWRTGWMHNRMRMVVGSFLTKDLLVDWREGERWFWDTLVDGDIASNASQWQWIAGSGADAQPFFRIFNPVSQGQKFDAGGAYIRAHLPELAKLSDKDIHMPWLASEATLARAGVKLGETYPRPIVDHAMARERALAAYRATRGPGGT